MGRPFTYVSSQLYYDIEVYLFKLAMYTDSKEYGALSVKNRNRIDGEINSMKAIIDVMRMFRQIPADEKAILGWKAFLDHEDEHRRIFRFSSSTVAQKCLGVHPGKVHEVCKGNRRTTGGYIFQYDDDHVPVVKEKKKWFDY